LSKWFVDNAMPPAINRAERLDLPEDVSHGVVAEASRRTDEPYSNRSLEQRVAHQEIKPRWEGRRLWFGEKLVREYGREASRQFPLLEAFEAAHWAERIPSPLEEDALSLTIKDLNRMIKDSPIKFGEDKGKFATWHLR
jgi:hypothetical protein